MRSCNISFHAIFQTTFGQEVFICGNHPELGCWEPSRALKLFTNEKTYPKWKSNKKIQISQGYLLQFKICVYQGNRFSRWQKFPNQNRTFKVDCREITLLIIQNSQSLVQEKRFNYQSTTEIFSVQVRKYSSFIQDEFQTEQTSESSSSNSVDYFEKQSYNSMNEPEIRSLISTFRYIISEGLFVSKNKMTKLSDFENDHSENVKLNKINNIIYLLNLPDKNRLTRQEQLKNNQLLFFNINDQNWLQNSQNVCQKLQEIAAKQSSFLQSTLILEGSQFALIPKLLINKFYNPTGFKIILNIDSLTFIRQKLLVLDNLYNLVMEAILLVDGLIFANVKIFEQFMDLVQGDKIDLSLKEIQCDQKCQQQENIYYIIQDSKNKNKKQDLIKLMIAKQKRSKYNIEKIVSIYEKCKNKKIFFFSFGKYEDFSYLINNRQILLKMSSQVLIYVFTPNKLSLFTNIIQLFSKIIFISYTYLQLAYNHELFTLLKTSQTQIYLTDIIDEINQEISSFPNVKLTIDKNIINVKSVANSTSHNSLQKVYQQVDDLITHFNQTTNQNLVIDFINESCFEIKHIYQTQFFFSNLILKNSETSVDFLHLTVVDRLCDSRFEKSLTDLFLEEKSSYNFETTKFFSSRINFSASKKHKEMTQQQISAFLIEIFKQHSQSYYHKLKLANSKIMQKLRFEM